MRISRLVLSILSVSVFFVSAMNAQSVNESIGVRHVVCFKFTSESSQNQIDELVEAFATLENLIPQVKDFEWGINNSPEGLEKGMTHCFVLTFNDEKGRDEYLTHLHHKAFVEKFGPMIEDVFVFDYMTK